MVAVNSVLWSFSFLGIICKFCFLAALFWGLHVIDSSVKSFHLKYHLHIYVLQENPGRQQTMMKMGAVMRVSAELSSMAYSSVYLCWPFSNLSFHCILKCTFSLNVKDFKLSSFRSLRAGSKFSRIYMLESPIRGTSFQEA